MEGRGWALLVVGSRTLSRCLGKDRFSAGGPEEGLDEGQESPEKSVRLAGCGAWKGLRCCQGFQWGDLQGPNKGAGFPRL